MRREFAMKNGSRCPADGNLDELDLITACTLEDDGGAAAHDRDAHVGPVVVEHRTW